MPEGETQASEVKLVSELSHRFAFDTNLITPLQAVRQDIKLTVVVLPTFQPAVLAHCLCGSILSRSFAPFASFVFFERLLSLRALDLDRGRS